MISGHGRKTEEALQAMTKSNPQGRLIRPDEVANAVAWLCCRERIGHRPKHSGGRGELMCSAAVDLDTD